MSKDIRKLRALAGWSQYQLASATGIDRTRLSLFENQHLAPTMLEQIAIEEVLLEGIEQRSRQLLDVLSA